MFVGEESRGGGSKIFGLPFRYPSAHKSRETPGFEEHYSSSHFLSPSVECLRQTGHYRLKSTKRTAFIEKFQLKYYFALRTSRNPSLESLLDLYQSINRPLENILPFPEFPHSQNLLRGHTIQFRNGFTSIFVCLWKRWESGLEFWTSSCEMTDSL